MTSVIGSSHLYQPENKCFSYVPPLPNSLLLSSSPCISFSSPSSQQHHPPIELNNCLFPCQDFARLSCYGRNVKNAHDAKFILVLGGLLVGGVVFDCFGLTSLNSLTFLLHNI